MGIAAPVFMRGDVPQLLRFKAGMTVAFDRVSVKQPVCREASIGRPEGVASSRVRRSPEKVFVAVCGELGIGRERALELLRTASSINRPSGDLTQRFFEIRSIVEMDTMNTSFVEAFQSLLAVHGAIANDHLRRVLSEPEAET
jgi:hypothetical protein